jgi:hypothetical protein
VSEYSNAWIDMRHENALNSDPGADRCLEALRVVQITPDEARLRVTTSAAGLPTISVTRVGAIGWRVTLCDQRPACCPGRAVYRDAW